MITGDNKLTAKVTAVECNICEENDLAMEGYQFAELIDDKEKIRKIICKEPKLKVLARARPEDKYKLVTSL